MTYGAAETSSLTDDARLALIRVATAQRNMLSAFGVAICIRWVHWSLALVALVAVAYFAAGLAAALKRSVPAFYAMLAIIPLVNLVVMLVLSSAATKALGDAGVAVGFLGASLPLKKKDGTPI
jgi:hypothetical protein